MVHRAFLLLFLSGLCALLLTGCGRGVPSTLQFAAGAQGGAYLPVGRGLQEVLAASDPRVTLQVLETEGSTDNMRRLMAGEVDLALVQSDEVGGDEIRVLASLYEEVLHVVVRSTDDDPIRTALDLRGRELAAGPRGGGTLHVARSVLSHFGIEQDDARVRSVSHADALRAFREGEVDGVFVLAGVPAESVCRLLDVEDATLLSLGALDDPGSALAGMELTLPGMDDAAIPAYVYGRRPVEGVGTIGVQALLVARADLSPHAAAHVTRALFENRVRMTEAHPAMARLAEDAVHAPLRHSLHEGAVWYYERNAPSFVVEYAEPISLGLTLFVGAFSFLVAARGFLRRNRKNRIDRYYVEVEKIGRLSVDADADQLHALRSQLHDLRSKAFRELVAEKLAADESFTIFQDFVGSELAALEDRCERLRRGLEA